MSHIESFFGESFLEGCSKERLLKIAEHYRIEIGDKRLKDTVKSILKAKLYDMNISPGKPGGAGDAAGAFLPRSQVGNLSFEQQKSCCCCCCCCSCSMRS